MAMEVIFLGTGSAIPTFERNVLSIAVLRKNEILLFDCGEGTQHQFIKAGIKISKLQHIFISHLHGDHLYGIMGLLSSLNLNSRMKTLSIYGPHGLKEFIECLCRLSKMQLNYSLEIHEFQELNTITRIMENRKYHVEAISLKHRIPCLGFALVEKDIQGKMDGKLANILKIPNGPVRGLLKSGKDVVLENGRLIKSKTLVGNSTPGKKIAICTDTMYCSQTVEISKNSDLLIHECTFTSYHQNLAITTMHSTFNDAITVAQQAQVKKLALIHFSSRYKKNEFQMEEKKSVFPNCILTYDLLRISV